jgi:hypothetical protein
MNNRRLVFLALAVLAVVACDQLDDYEPTGTPFALDDNISLVAITGHGGVHPSGPATVAMTVSSRTSNVETDVLPAGLTFKRRSTETQHVVLLKPHTVSTGTGSRTELLGTFCCNRGVRSPDSDDTLDLGPITDDTGLREIIDLVQDKDISGSLDVWMVQRAVWLVTDSSGLTAAYRDSLNALPDDSVKISGREFADARRGR